MANSYRNQEWSKFRKEVIELDGNRCAVCGRSGLENIVLQVHHKTYVSGKLPWEYSYGDCETLCKGCHAREHGLIPPSFGWSFISENDLGSLDGTCELCGKSIRYVFSVFHPNWEMLNVGTICCDNLTGTKIASGIMDSKKRYEDRLKRFQDSSRWKQKGHSLVIRQQNIDAEIVPNEKGFRVLMNNVQGRFIYPSVCEAKSKIFETIENGSAKECLDKREGKMK